MNRIAAGPMVTTQIAGKMQKTSGNTILTPVFAAASSARWRRLVRSVSEYDAQRLRHAGAELVGLDQHRDERAEVVDAGAVGEIAQRLGARLAGAQLEVDQPQLVGQLGIRERQLACRPACSAWSRPRPGLDADHQQVEHVGERQPDPVRAALGHPREHHAGQDVAEAEARRARRAGSALREDRRREQHEQPERERRRGCRRRWSAPRRGGSRPAPGAAGGCPSPWATAAPSRRPACSTPTSACSRGFSSTSGSAAERQLLEAAIDRRRRGPA